MVDQTQRRTLLLAAIKRLPPIPRQVLTLALEGLTVREIAEVAGITENNTAVRLSRARELLRQEFAPATKSEARHE